jgi:hypothetical protein
MDYETATVHHENGDEYKAYSYYSPTLGLEFQGRETEDHSGVVVNIVDWDGTKVHSMIASDWESGFEQAYDKFLLMSTDIPVAFARAFAY